MSQHHLGFSSRCRHVTSKPVPRGSDVYESVLDDLRQNSAQSSSSSSASSLSSSSTPARLHPYCVTAQAELRGHGNGVGHDLGHRGRDLDGFEGRCHSDDQWKRSCASCSRGIASRDCCSGAPSASAQAGGLSGRGTPHDRSANTPTNVEKAGRVTPRDTRLPVLRITCSSASPRTDYARRSDRGWEETERGICVQDDDDENFSPCLQISDFVTDLNLEALSRQGDTNDMGHSSSLLPHHHKRQGREHHVGGGGGGDSHHNHNSHPPRVNSSQGRRHSSPATQSLYRDRVKDAARDLGVKIPSHANGTSSHSLTRSAPGHVVTWSAAAGCQGQSKYFTNSDELGDLGHSTSSGKPHTPLSRLYPRGTNSNSTSPKQTSPTSSGRASSGSRGDTGGGGGDADYMTSSGYCPSRPDDHTRGVEWKGVGTEEGRKLSPKAEHSRQRGSSPVAPGAEALLDVRHGRKRQGYGVNGGGSRSPSTSPQLLRPPGQDTSFSPSSSPSLSRSGRGDGSGGRSSHDSCSRSLSSPTPTSSLHRAHSPNSLRLHSPADSHAGNGARHSPTSRRAHSPNTPHIRLCTYGPAENSLKISYEDDDEFAQLSEQFRPRAVSDISIHARRRRHLPRPPHASRTTEEEDDHAHVHWADEARGSPLATSVLLSSIRPRALSHGSADMPRKPILKKPFGF
ncbi:dentin sialophosphoprotein-like [Littorina saxatilis]|uniref:dentin sialophosphoprotein-like n=1 Tax=Littorina saxatilis TaxID=31220 RepID=UPI0038B57896